MECLISKRHDCFLQWSLACQQVSGMSVSQVPAEVCFSIAATNSGLSSVELKESEKESCQEGPVLDTCCGPYYLLCDLSGATSEMRTCPATREGSVPAPPPDT